MLHWCEACLLAVVLCDAQCLEYGESFETFGSGNAVQVDIIMTRMKLEFPDCLLGAAGVHQGFGGPGPTPQNIVMDWARPLLSFLSTRESASSATESTATAVQHSWLGQR